MSVGRRIAHRAESGFAMLLVFAMASAMAVLLYMETPRILFEAQRQKEQLLIERGEQYKRAIQVYYRKTKKLPQRVEDLERGTETRFLRRRYKDPFTGKDDWKLIETDGVNLKNSLVKKPPAALSADGKTPAAGAPAESLTAQTQQPGLIAFGPTGQPMPAQPCIPGQPCEQNQALQRRASDRPAANAGGPGGEPQGLPACDPTQPVDPARCDPGKVWDPAAVAQQALQQQPQLNPGIPGANPYPGQPSGYPLAPGQQPVQFQPQAGGVPGLPGGLAGLFPGSAPGGTPRLATGAGYPPVGAPPVSSQTGGAAGSPLIPGAAGAASNQALNLINQLLTTPRQGGVPGQANAGALGPGIVGVASKYEGLGIKLYAEREKYQEWEFVYDPKEEKVPNMAGNQQQQQPGANPLGRGTGATGSTSSSPTAPSSPFPGAGGFGGMGRQR